MTFQLHNRLILRPPLLFFCSVFRGRPGVIHHVSGREVDIGGRGPIFEYVQTKLESKFLTDQDE